MPKTIVLTSLAITAWTYFPVNPRVTVSYQLSDAAGRVYESGETTFWATLPSNSVGRPLPANWYPLPANRATQLAQITDLVNTALAGLVT